MVEIQDFTVMFEKNPLAHAVVDGELKIVMVNEAFCKLVGYSRDRLLALRFSDFRTQNLIRYLKDSGESVMDAVNQRRITKGESTFETSSGIHVVFRTNIPVLDEKNEIRFVYITYNEVTQAVRIQQYMAKEVEQLSNVYGKMAEGDLTVRYEITKPDEDTKATYDQIIKLRDAVRGIVVNVEENIADVNKRMLNLTSTADNASTSIEDASKSVNQIQYFTNF